MALELEALTSKVIGCAIAVHKELGPGYLESIYENALIVEFKQAGLQFRHQKEHPVLYRGKEVGRHRFDLLVDNVLIVELKAIKALEDIHFAQTRSYMKALKLKHGLLLNFATMPLTVKRVIYDPGV